MAAVLKRYDLHSHTRYSWCSTNNPKKILAMAKKRGLNGIAITDHNEIAGALEVAKYNDDPDFEVIVGEEVRTTDFGDLLVWYVKEKIEPATLKEVLSIARKQGAITSLAHPYSGGLRGGKGDQLTNDCLPDAIEGKNGRMMSEKGNKLAQKLAKKYNLPITGGSDGHFLHEIGCCWTEFEGDLKTAIKEGRTKIGGKRKYPALARSGSVVVKTIKMGLKKLKAN